MKHKTIAEHMRDVFIEGDELHVGYGDAHVLDDCAKRCTHTNLMTMHPLDRHQRILNALDRSPLFEKFFSRADIWTSFGNGSVEGYYRRFLRRCYKLKGDQ